MAKWALIVDGVVRELTNIDPENRFPPDMNWVSCPSSVKEGDLYEDGSFDGGLTLDQAKQMCVEVLRSLCDLAIVGGFSSSALGTSHLYPSDIKAQINLMGSVTDSMMPNPDDWSTPFWVCDADGVWAFKMHSRAEIQQAGRDGKAHVVRHQTALDNLTVAVWAAETIEDVDSITWEATVS